MNETGRIEQIILRYLKNNNWAKKDRLLSFIRAQYRTNTTERKVTKRIEYLLKKKIITIHTRVKGHDVYRLTTLGHQIVDGEEYEFGADEAELAEE